MIRATIRIAAALVLPAWAAAAEAEAPPYYYAPSPYTVDPYDVRPQAWMRPSYSDALLWQLDPFGVGYDLLGGYRPIYRGARQPIGHEIIETHGGNGYVYRPIYAPSPGYHYALDGSLIIETPTRSEPTVSGVDAARPPPNPLPPRTPTPPPPVSPRRGPREF